MEVRMRAIVIRMGLKGKLEWMLAEEWRRLPGHNMMIKGSKVQKIAIFFRKKMTLFDHDLHISS
jgi:hypothetical protein